MITLQDEHIAYEYSCREMFIGETIRGVIYGELNQYLEEGEPPPEPMYSTIFPDIDTLDHSIYFETNNSTIYIFWDSTFACYGLLSQRIDLIETTNTYEQRWDVSHLIKWRDFIGRVIVDFRIIWHASFMVDNFGNLKVSGIYPQAFKISTDNNQSIMLSAADIDRDGKFGEMSDNILVTTNPALFNKLADI